MHTATCQILATSFHVKTPDTNTRTRRGTDWIAARDHYLAQDPPRSFEDIGRRFGISGQRVGQIARRDNWAKLAADVDAAALEQAKKRIVRTRAERVVKMLGIIDGFVDRFDVELDDIELRAADLERLGKLAELLEGEATDRISVGEAQQGFSALMQIALEFIPKESRQAFVARVRESIGDFGAGSA